MRLKRRKNRARERALRSKKFTVAFYGRPISLRKTAQSGDTRRKPSLIIPPLKNPLRNVLKSCAKTRYAIINQLLYQLSYAGAIWLRILAYKSALNKLVP